MIEILKRSLIATCLLSFTYSVANDKVIDKNGVIAKEKQIPQHVVSNNKNGVKDQFNIKNSTETNYKSFTGKILGNGIRMRLHPDVDSNIIKELQKDELVVVIDEKNDFYAIYPPSDAKVYIFRSFILDNIVEGNRVNVRLAPELNSPIVGYMNTGDKVNGKISDKNHKWLEISPPKNVKFYVAKEFIEKIGGPEVKDARDKKIENANRLIDAADLSSQSEMMKPFEEIDFEKISNSFNNIMCDYNDLSNHVEKAKNKLTKLQDIYLQKKLTYLEAKASRIDTTFVNDNDVPEIKETNLSYKDRVKIWERIEESYFLTWASNHHYNTLEDFYEEQKENSTRISGIIEPYNDTVKNKPGNFIIRDRDVPKAYLYSTKIALQNYTGKYVTLVVADRQNNNFAFPAYFVLEVE